MRTFHALGALLWLVGCGPAFHKLDADELTPDLAARRATARAVVLERSGIHLQRPLPPEERAAPQRTSWFTFWDDDEEGTPSEKIWIWAGARGVVVGGGAGFLDVSYEPGIVVRYHLCETGGFRLSCTSEEVIYAGKRFVSVAVPLEPYVEAP